jgi:glycosyltransferase involved in cell wall biosynthesis
MGRHFVLAGTATSPVTSRSFNIQDPSMKLAHPLCIAVVTDVFSKEMGYAESALPKALASLGADVHVITTRLAPHYNRSDFQKMYGQLTRSAASNEDSERVDGYTVHHLDHVMRFGYLRMRGLYRKLRELRPDAVQVFSAISWTPLGLAAFKPLVGYRLITGNHTHSSVFPLAQRRTNHWDLERLKCLLLRALPGRIISFATEKCFGTTVDCADLAVRFFGVPRAKMAIEPLGVDTSVFYPDRGPKAQRARSELRASLGCADSEILCIYTGRLTPEKNPLLLARAVSRLRAAREPYRALFVGNGPQEEAIAACDGSSLHPFVQFRDLARFFRAADVAVYPTQETTSMLDAAACGLPLIVNDTLQASERTEGSGVTYRLNDGTDLVRAIRSLSCSDVRQTLGSCGAARMAAEFSWAKLARRRMDAYSHAANRSRR